MPGVWIVAKEQAESHPSSRQVLQEAKQRNEKSRMACGLLTFETIMRFVLTVAPPGWLGLIHPEGHHSGDREFVQAR